MCGITGIVTAAPPDDLERVVRAMTSTLAHRGPDDEGIAAFPDAGAALGMRRLSIIDLAGGRQPMWDEQRRRCVVFNGEIYNFAELRRELEGLGHRFASDHSDTEVLVHGHEEWGEGLPARLNGMFAFAVWDTVERRMLLARDRTGEKPLFVARVPGGWAFASELKALFALPGFRPSLDVAGVEQYLEWGYTVAPRTILTGVEKLPPGCSATLTAERYDVRRYWAPSFEPDERPEGELLDELDALLDSSVAMRMVADVPVGLLLSGGLDSSTIGWYMRRHGDDVRSFSIGFEEAPYDESHWSSLAAEHLGTRHHLEILSQARALELVPRIPEILDEPMGDQSVFPTALLSTVARRGVTVALGGDGSDELLMGYTAYPAVRVAARLDRLPLAVRRGAAALARRAPVRVAGRPVRGVGSLRGLDRPTSDRVLAFLGALKGEARGLLSPEARAALPARRNGAVPGVASGLSADDEAVATFLGAYLPDDILVKTDRASMAASLELRAPFLDPRLVDFLLRVPASHKLDGGPGRRGSGGRGSGKRGPGTGGSGKLLLKRLMAGRLPDGLVERPKRGFDLPLSAWLRESLAPLVRESLSPERVRAGGLLDPAAVDAVVREHLSGRADRGREVWLLLQLELWRERWLA